MTNLLYLQLKGKGHVLSRLATLRILYCPQEINCLYILSMSLFTLVSTGTNVLMTILVYRTVHTMVGFGLVKKICNSVFAILSLKPFLEK